MKIKYLLLLTSLAFLVFSCEKKPAGSKNQFEGFKPGDTLASLISDLQSVPTIGIETPASIYGQRETFSGPDLKFSMADVIGLNNYKVDSIPFSAMLKSQAPIGNGLLTFYFLEGERKQNSGTHIRVEYLARNYPGRSTVDSLFSWFKDYHISAPRNGRIISEGKPVKTLDNQEVNILEIYTPSRFTAKDSTQNTAKILALAYVEQGNNFIAFNLSSTETGKYKKAITLFRYLISSFKDEK